MDLFLIGLIGLSIVPGAAIRPGTPVFLVVPVSLACGVVAAVYCLALKYDFAAIAGAALSAAIACQIGYALRGICRRRPLVGENRR